MGERTVARVAAEGGPGPRSGEDRGDASAVGPAAEPGGATERGQVPRPWLLGAGILVLAGCWMGPLPALAHRSFTAHMTMHMGVVAVGSGLVALGLAGGRWDPARRWPAPFSALLASLVELVIVWGWHAPAPHHFARQEPVGLVLEQGSFLLAGLYLWLSAFGGGEARRRERAAAGVMGLLLTSMHMTLLGALLSLAQRPLYAHGGLHGGPAAFGLSPLADQQLGGAVMLLVGSATYLLGGLWLAAGLVRRRLAEGEDRRGKLAPGPRGTEVGKGGAAAAGAQDGSLAPAVADRPGSAVETAMDAPRRSG